jgi:5-hydroxyisourate hydrolase-like protein (transthyretin family)
MFLRKLVFVFALFFSAAVCAQPADTLFQKEWLGIDTLIVQNDLTRSALAKVAALYKKAKQKQLHAQVIKCLIYEYTLQNRVTDDGSNSSLNRIRKELADSPDETAKAILHSLLAKRYRQHLERNLWKIRDRKRTTDISQTDISTWGTADFIEAIQQHLAKSLANAKQLQQIPVGCYDAVLKTGTARSLRPTLYDLLAHEALDYFTSGEQLLVRRIQLKPTTAFILPGKPALATIDNFISYRFLTRDSSSPNWNSLRLFQQLLQFHRKDRDPGALLELNTERIEWAYQQTDLAEKDVLYATALKEMTAAYPASTATAQAWYLQARKLADKAATYEPFQDSTGRWNYRKAKEMAEKALALFSGKEIHPGIANLQNLLRDIHRKELSTRTESVNLPGKPFRALVNYRNIDTLYTRIIRVDNADFPENNFISNEDWKKVTRQKAFRNIALALPATEDHQLHAVEIKLDELPAGSYALLCSDNKQFNDSLHVLSLQYFQVSQLSYVRNGNDFFVLNRATGQPIPDVTVHIYKSWYSGREWVNYPVTTKTTDKNGRFSYTAETKNERARFTLELKNDQLVSQEQDYIFQNDAVKGNPDSLNYEKRNQRMFFFTDRSIYRPGQSVFFKGIAVSRDYHTKRSKRFSTKEPYWVYLLDANQKTIDSLQLTLNDFSSLSGNFRLPKNVLTGSFSLSLKQIPVGGNYFSVEEYKRPGFQVSFDKITAAYRLQDSVTVTGQAMAYAGNSIAGSKVVYNITRTTHIREPWQYWRRSYPSRNDRQIGSGETSTDATGKFSIGFIALADDIIDRSGNPYFDYKITADITDSNGETRSSETIVRIGATSLQLSLNSPAVMETDSLNKISISTTNLSDEKQAAAVQLHIYALQEPGRLVRKRYWQRPDQFLLSKESFLQHFPSDEYEEESAYQNWPVIRAVSDTLIDTKTTDHYTILPGTLPAGFYKVEAISTDAYGEKVTAVTYLQLFNTTSASFGNHNTNFLFPYKKSIQPGETAHFASGSTNNLFVIRQTLKANDEKGAFQFIDRKKGLENIRYTATEDDRGGISIAEIFVWDNRAYQNTYEIEVPWRNKELQVSYASWRNQTAPGSKETWTITVQGESKEKNAAEMLTGMYDASLDQFTPHNWAAPYLWPNHSYRNLFSATNNFRETGSVTKDIPVNYLPVPAPEFDQLAVDGQTLWNQEMGRWISDSVFHLSAALQKVVSQFNESVIDRYGMARKKSVAGATIQIRGISSGDQNKAMLSESSLNNLTVPNAPPAETNDTKENAPVLPDLNQVVLRKNFNETAFFLPHLYADSSGKYSFSFTMPEALTQWKWMSLAHTRDLAFGYNSDYVVTQKQLMVQPNMPRFLREGDNLELSSKIVNMSDKELTGQVSLELVDAATQTSVDGWFQNVFPTQYFTVEAGKSFLVKFPVQIPFNFNRPLTWRIKASTGGVSDGEENTLPIVTNRLLVTESLPLFVSGDTTRQFRFDKLIRNNSESLTQEAITVEYSSNPIWYAVQALPYLMEYPYECAEQSFNRLYANLLASWILNKDPLMKKVFTQWQQDSSSLQSNLQKNEELKQILLQETPWVLAAESEEQQKKNLALLFDLVKLGTQTDALIEKLTQLQLPSGAFSWFKGGYEDRYITNYILTGIGKLKRLGALSPEASGKIRNLLVNALRYLDAKNEENYQTLIKNKVDLNKYLPTYGQVEYLYMRSFFRDIAQQSPKAYAYFFAQAKKTWVQQNSYNKAQLGLVFYRNGAEKTATGSILPALLENAVIDPQLGMYWKTTYGRYWYQSPIEHQSMIIAFVSEVNQSSKNASIDKQLTAMRTWLLLNKQTNHWKTTIATADACYALLLNGEDWLNRERTVTIQLGKTQISSSREKTAAGTGYFKKRIEGSRVTNDMGNITVTTQSSASPFTGSQKNTSPSWGNVYWQYFEDLDKITSAATPLSISKKFFIEKNSDNGKLLQAVSEGEELKIGDKLIVRLELRSNRDMDYLHLKDMRAAAMEPVNVLSGYRWQDGLGYYESTKDVSTNFFIDHLSKGTYVFEYPMFITHSGLFSAGIASIQCMYAPEFTSHSEGIKIRVAR